MHTAAVSFTPQVIFQQMPQLQALETWLLKPWVSHVSPQPCKTTSLICLKTVTFLFKDWYSYGYYIWLSDSPAQMTNYALASRIKSLLDHWDGARLEFTPVDPQRDIFTATPVNSNLHIRDLRIRQHQHEKHYASGSAISHKDNYTYHQPKECTEITHTRLATIFTSGPKCTRTQTRKHSASWNHPWKGTMETDWQWLWGEYCFHIHIFMLYLDIMNRQNLAPIYKRYNEVKAIASQKQ